MRMLRMALVLCAGMGPAPAVAAEAWPTRPIKLVVPFSAAGTGDLRRPARRPVCEQGSTLSYASRPL